MSTDTLSGATDDATAETRDKPVHWTVVVAVIMTAVLEVLDMTIVNVALPHIKAAFGITSDQTIWIITSYIVASVVVMPLTGLFSRWFGQRRLISAAIIGFATFSALSGLSWSLDSIVFFRLGQGLFGAFLIPLSQSILFQSFPKEKRGQAMALFGLGVVVAPVLGPTLGALLTEFFTWRAVFYVNAPMAALALILITGELKREPIRPVTIDWTGLLFMTGMIGALQFVLDQGQTRGWFTSHVIQLAALVSVLSAVAFFARGWRRKANVIDFGLLRDRSFAGANVAIMGFGLAMYGTIALLPLFVQGLLGYPTLSAGYLFIPRGLAAGVSMVLTGAVLVRRFDPRLLLTAGLVLTGLGNFGLGYLNTNADFWQLSWPGIISGLGMGLFFVPISTLAFQNIEARDQDEASGLYGVTRSLGSSLGIAVVGWQLVSRTQFHWARLAAGISSFNPDVTAYLRPLGLTPETAQAAQQLAGQVARQSQMLAFQDVFFLTGWAAFAMLPLVLIMQKPSDDGAATAVVH